MLKEILNIQFQDLCCLSMLTRGEEEGAPVSGIGKSLSSEVGDILIFLMIMTFYQKVKVPGFKAKPFGETNSTNIPV